MIRRSLSIQYSFILLCIIASTLLFAIKSHCEEVESLYIIKFGEAERACSEGKWATAEKALVEALSLEPDNPSNPLLLSNLGMIRFNMGLDSLAIETLTEAHDLAPSSVTILANRARIYLFTGQQKEAIEDFGNVLRIDSMDVTSRFNHCLLSLREHNFRTAGEDFNFLVRNYPDRLETDIAGASYLSGTGQYLEAVPYYTKVIEERPESEYYGGRAFCYLLLDRLQEASDDINTALSLSPEDGELFLYRAALNKRRYRPVDAEADALRAEKLGVDPKRVRQFIDHYEIKQ